MNLDKDIYAVITYHISKGASVTQVLAVLGNHLASVVQCVSGSPELKISIAKEIMSCVVDQVTNDPNPMARKLN